MNTITMDEILGRKAELERALTDAIKDFEDATNLEVSDIQMHRVLVIGSRKMPLTEVVTKVGL